MKSFYSNGKLLLTGEYLVLDGATALVLPTKFGQSLEIEAAASSGIHWKSFDKEGRLWFEEKFEMKEGKAIPETTSDSEVSARLATILTEAAKLNPEALSGKEGVEVASKLFFDRDWGLGSSSTLINNIAQWFEVDAYSLLWKSFGGSGFDIAAAKNDSPVLYTLKEGNPDVLITNFDPPFKKELFFVHLNRKQNSRHSIQHYRKQPKEQLISATEKLSVLTHQLLTSQNIKEFELYLDIHETLISQVINTVKLKISHFPDYPRSLKSLGGWGGDFFLATGGEAERRYFRDRGHSTILEYEEMIL